MSVDRLQRAPRSSQRGLTDYGDSSSRNSILAVAAGLGDEAVFRP